MNDPDKPQVHAVHFLMKQAILTDNRIIPVTNWFGSDGQECDPRMAVTCVAGCEDAGWYAIDLRQFGLATVH